jgi:hypothetical protein
MKPSSDIESAIARAIARRRASGLPRWTLAFRGKDGRVFTRIFSDGRPPWHDSEYTAPRRTEPEAACQEF